MEDKRIIYYETYLNIFGKTKGAYLDLNNRYKEAEILIKNNLSLDIYLPQIKFARNYLEKCLQSLNQAYSAIIENYSKLSINEKLTVRKDHIIKKYNALNNKVCILLNDTQKFLDDYNSTISV